MVENDQALVYVGTYTRRPGDNGIFVFRLNLANGRLRPVEAVKAVNPSFLILSPDKRFLYAVSETTTFNGLPGGGVSAYSVDPVSGRLEFINSQPTHGEDPCHIGYHAGGRCLWIANYSGGSVTVLPVNEDGSLGQARAVIRHQGRGPHPTRQEKAHAHSATIDPQGRYALVADLGLDCIFVYSTDEVYRSGVGRACFELHAASGAGPRHVEFHPHGRFIYITNELDSTVSACDYDGESGSLRAIQTLSMLPADFHGENTAADLHVAPSVRFLYASNRGHDSLAIYKLDPASGKMTPAGMAPSLGKTPRNFAIHPGGRLMIIANQGSDSLSTCWMDEESGGLIPTGETVTVHAPVCVKIADGS